MAAGGVWGERCGMQPGQRIWTDGFVRVTPNLAQPLVPATKEKCCFELFCFIAL